MGMDIVPCMKIPSRQLVLRFVDNCGGIAADKVQNIFKPFFKAKGQIWDSGLALAVANRIVKAYGGDIDVESETGRGTTFQISLPVESVY
ncbi:MAG: hypothetical protein J7M40_01280 [Planctomycetes bacterium]|nr:hypothetical protein [Planctomycetota bacterium]